MGSDFNTVQHCFCDTNDTTNIIYLPLDLLASPTKRSQNLTNADQD